MKNLRTIRESKNMSQTQLAKLSGCTQCNISLYEYGKKVPRLTTATNIARALKVDLHDILGE